MAKRKSTGKRLRFEVFKRDGFTCQYCGAQPPGVVLVADHIDAVASGGATELMNLITACEACNQGKGGRALGQVQIRPDADLPFLETQQEIAELRRFREAQALRDEALNDLIEDLRDGFFAAIEPKRWGPTVAEVRRVIDRYGLEAAAAAVEITASAIADGRIWDHSAQFVPYMFGVARHIADGDG